MAQEPDYLSITSALLNEALAEDMMRAAEILLMTYEFEKSLFPLITKATGIKQRRAYALIRIAKVFRYTGFSHTKLNKIGWTKLSILTPYIDENNILDLVALAETMTAYSLSRYLAGETVIDNAKAMLFRLAPEEDLRLRKLLKAHGAMGALPALKGKEAALIKIMDLLEQGQATGGAKG